MLNARRAVRVAVAGAAAVTLLLLLLRRPLATWVLGAALASRGVTLERVEVEEVGLRGAVLRRIRFGPLEIDRLALAYRPGELLRGGGARSSELRGVVLRLEPEDLALALAPGGGGLPSISAALAGLGAMRLRDARVEVSTPLGPLAVTAQGSVVPGEGGESRAELELGAGLGASALRGQLAGTLAGERLMATLCIEGGELELGGATVSALAGRASLARDARGGWSGSAELAAGAVRFAGPPLGPLRLQAALAGGRLEAESWLDDDAGEACLRARLEGGDPAAALAIDGELRARPGSRLWAASGLPPLTRGSAQAELALARRLDEPEPLHGSLRLSASDLDLAGTAAGLRLTLPLGLSVSAAGTTLLLETEAQAEAASLDPAWLRRLGLPDLLAGAVARHPTVGLRRAPGTAPLVLRLGEGPARLRGALTASFTCSGARVDAAGALDAGESGDLAARLAARLRLDRARLEGVELEDVTARLPLALVRDPGGPLRIRLTGPGDGLVTTARVGASLVVDRPTLLRLERGRAELPAPGAAAWLEAEMSTPRLELRAGAEAASPWRITGPVARLEVIAGPGPPRLRWSGAPLALAHLAVTAAEVTGEVELGESGGPGGHGLRARLRVEGLAHDAEPPAFERLRVEVDAHAEGDRLVIAGSALAGGGAPALPLAGWHDLVTAAGEVSIGPAALRFAPGGLQPSALSPLLAGLEDSAGEVTLEGRIAWAAGEPRVTGRLELGRLSFAWRPLRIEGLAGTVLVGSLEPLALSSEALTVERIDVGAGLALTAVQARAALLPGPPSLLRVAEAEATIAGGRLRAGELELSLAAGAERLATLRFERLDLGRLLAALDVAGLDGEGQLSGVVPVRIAGGKTTVPRGELRSDGPGVVRYRSPRAGEMLSQGGEPVELMLRALRDFRYRQLVATLELDASDEVHVLAALDGHNPEVLEGYPFHINVDLTGNAGSLLRAVTEGYRLGEGLKMRLR